MSRALRTVGLVRVLRVGVVTLLFGVLYISVWFLGVEVGW